MFSLASSIGRRLKNWKTKPMCSRRSFVRALSPRVVISWPASCTPPDVGLSRPARMCISVDFPEPDGPITAVALPGAMSTETPRSASTAVSPSPYRRVRSRATTTPPFELSILVPPSIAVARKATARGLAAHARIGQSAAVDPGTEIRFALERTRDETDGLLKPLSDEALSAPVPEPGLPLVWVLADIGRFEELWLLRSLDGQPPLAEQHDDVYEALRAERTRAGRPVTPRASDVRAYVDDVRERALEALARTDFEAPDPLLRKRFVFGLVLQHELQAQERLLQTIQLRTEVEYPGLRDAPRDRAPSGPEEISVPEGPFTLGAVDEPWALDNEL